MSHPTIEDQLHVDWNVLTNRWLEVLNLDAEARVCSPLEALNRAGELRCIAMGSPLDLFAANRFLLTLLYWKAAAAGGVQDVRESLLKGEIPRVVLDAIEAEASCFRLFDDEAPFLQDPSVRAVKKAAWKSAGSLFADCACGTNVAHFHHGDDKQMRLCLPCATIGMLRLVPWSQAGGAGLSPSVHNAPPIVAMASGKNLAQTLGLNLVDLSGKPGVAKWTGHFLPTARTEPIPYLEALTWNPRRVHLLAPQPDNICWRCGQRGIVAIGPIVYLKNENTKSNKHGQKTVPFAWQDPAAFYAAEALYTTIKSYDEEWAASGRDLASLLDQSNSATSAVVKAHPDHRGWGLVVPCTNPANNKTFDHRQLQLVNWSPDAIRAEVPTVSPVFPPQGLDGWTEPPLVGRLRGAARFVQAAAGLLTHADWAALSAAAYREMDDSPAAFDVLTGLLWSLRGQVAGLPSRNVAWLVLKLMATVPPRARVPFGDTVFCPLRALPKRQLDERRNGRPVASPYPLSLPRGQPLEAALRGALDKNLRLRKPGRIDWASLCHGLDQLLD